MRVTSVNVGAVAEIGGETGHVASAFRKAPIAHPVRVSRVGIVGDAQADQERHGGPTKAVYVYPSEHYVHWTLTLGQPTLPPGSFGENLTVEGWLEEETRPGDVYQIGSVEFEVTRPRFPCYKMGLVFGRPQILREFLESGRSGFYLGVRNEGSLKPGDRISRTRRGPEGPTIAELVSEAQSEKDEPDSPRP